jgi:general secretion pathway protein G
LEDFTVMNRHRRNRRAAFTLLEVLLVLVIIVLLAGLVAPALFNMQKRANIDAARAQVHALQEACDFFRLHINDYPANLNQLIEGREFGSKWSGPYLKDGRMPKDPWGHEFIYEPRAGGDKPVIFSPGPDGQPGTPDDVYEEES